MTWWQVKPHRKGKVFLPGAWPKKRLLRAPRHPVEFWRRHAMRKQEAALFELELESFKFGRSVHEHILEVILLPSSYYVHVVQIHLHVYISSASSLSSSSSSSTSSPSSSSSTSSPSSSSSSSSSISSPSSSSTSSPSSSSSSTSSPSSSSSSTSSPSSSSSFLVCFWYVTYVEFSTEVLGAFRRQFCQSFHLFAPESVWKGLHFWSRTLGQEQVCELKILGCWARKLGSMVRINGWFHLLINGIYWGYYLLITNLLLTSGVYPSMRGFESVNPAKNHEILRWSDHLNGFWWFLFGIK